MKCYFAGAESYPEMLLRNKATNWLIAYPSKKINQYRNKANIFIDSGAWSVFTGKKKINHPDYIKFIKAIGMDNYASLDVIGNPEQSLINLKQEVKQGLNPIPCYHLGEKLYYLEYYIDNFDAIALGGIARSPTKRKERFFDKCWSKISKKPTLKVHAYGVMSWELLSRFPFYSADGTSWFMGSKRGNIFPFGSDWVKTSQLNICTNKQSGFDKAVNQLRGSFMDFCHHDTTDEERAKRGNIRNEYNVKKYLELEKFLTRLWKKKGVTFA